MRRLVVFALAAVMLFSAMTVSAQESNMCTAVADGGLNYSDFVSFKSTKLRAVQPYGSMTLDDVRDEMLEFNEGIVVYDFKVPYIVGSEEQPYITAFMGTVLKNNPELFFVSNAFRYSYMGNYLYAIYPIYKYTKEQTLKMTDEYNTYIERITSHISDEWSELEKALYIHDYLVTSFEYDTSYNIYDAYSFFKNRTGVCESYALAFCALVRSVGLECVQVLSEQQNHLWNAVRIDGEYYHVDVTWDDPLTDRLGKASHKYFLMNDAETKLITATVKNPQTQVTYTATRDDLEILGDEDISCSSERFKSGFVWEDYEQPFVNAKGNWYKLNYNNSTGYAYLECVANDWKSSQIAVSMGEQRWLSSDGWWQEFYGGLFAIGDVVYSNTPDKLWYCDFRGGTALTGTVDVSCIAGIRSDNIYAGNYDALSGQITLEYKNNPNEAAGERISFYIPFLDENNPDFSDALIKARKLIMGLAADGGAYYDINGDAHTDVRDLIRFKKILVM